MAEISLRRAVEMTETVTQFSRLDSDATEEKIKLIDFVEELIDNNEYLLITDLKLSLDIDKNIKVKINRMHLYSLFTNIIKNAIDALEETADKEIHISL